MVVVVVGGWDHGSGMDGNTVVRMLPFGAGEGRRVEPGDAEWSAYAHPRRSSRGNRVCGRRIHRRGLQVL